MLQRSRFLNTIRTLSLFVLIFVGLVTIFYFYDAKSTNFIQNIFKIKYYTASKHVIPEQSKTNGTNKKNFLLLYWGYPWGIKSYVPAEGPTAEGCEVTHNHKRLPEADVIIFHYTVISSGNLPWKFYRHPDQIFVWWSAENPAVLRTTGEKNWGSFDNFFNWTWTYRRDADVLRNYGYRNTVISGLPRGKKVVDDIIASKKKLAIWIVSQCSYTIGARKRLAFAKELRKAGLDFNGYGRCFPESPPLPRPSVGHDQEMIKTVKEHKFYFAFENGLHCKDYITEKFWHKGLGLDTIPIVWGPTKEDILSVAPLNSFIFAEDYETPEKLVEYINFLDENHDEYRKYFWWREEENMTDEKMIQMTRQRYPTLAIQETPKTLCQVLHENRPRKIIKSLKKEFLDNDPKECTG